MAEVLTEPAPITHQPEPPRTADLRSNPNGGQAPVLGLRDGSSGAAQAIADIGSQPQTRDDPNIGGSFMAPQPNIGERGYSLNSLGAPPNHMVPRPGNDLLAPGQTPCSPSDLSAWDMWETT